MNLIQNLSGNPIIISNQLSQFEGYSVAFIVCEMSKFGALYLLCIRMFEIEPYCQISKQCRP